MRIKEILGIISLGLFLVYFASSFVFAQKAVQVYFFYSLSCPFCAKENKFLKELEEKYPQLEVKRYPLINRENAQLLEEFYKNYNVPKKERGRVPISFIGNKYFLGFNESIGKEIEKTIQDLIQGTGPQITSGPTQSQNLITIPLFGKIDLSKLSLPLISVVLGLLDGFNVCSLGALVLIISLVLGLRSRKRVFVLGGIFILTTAIIYGVLIIFWYKLFSFLSPYLRKMEILIGLLAIFGGIYFAKEFIKFKKRGVVCEMEFGQKISSSFSLKFQEAFKKGVRIATLAFLVFAFAAVITIVEFPCSAAVPLVYAGILASSHLPTFYYLLYISLYTLFYMFDEILVFLVAVIFMRLWLASNKAVLWITLIESLLLFGLGFYYLFAPFLH